MWATDEIDENWLTLSHFSARVRGAMRSMILLTDLAIDMAGPGTNYEVCSSLVKGQLSGGQYSSTPRSGKAPWLEAAEVRPS